MGDILDGELVAWPGVVMVVKGSPVRPHSIKGSPQAVTAAGL